MMGEIKFHELQPYLIVSECIPFKNICKLGDANPHFVVKMCREGSVHSVHSRGHGSICRGSSRCTWWLSFAFPGLLVEHMQRKDGRDAKGICREVAVFEVGPNK